MMREEFMQNYLKWKGDKHSTNSEASNIYISLLISMWAELYPKVEGRSDQSELVKEFDKFTPYRYDPKKMYEDAKDEPTIIFDLDKCLGKAVHVLKLTEIEG